MKIKAKIPQHVIIKTQLFLVYAAASIWLTYFYVYLKEEPHLSSFEIGIIAMFMQFNNLFVLPVWGLWADRVGRKKTLLYALGISLLLLPLFMVLDGAPAITLFSIIMTLVYNPISTLMDTIALDYEEESGGQTTYGQIRLWASFGWGLASVIAGVMLNHLDIIYIFPIAAVVFMLAWLILYFLYTPLKTTKNLVKLRRGVIWDLLKADYKLLTFLIIIFVYNVLAAPIYLLLNVYYHEIGAGNDIIGLAFMVQAFVEIPFFFFGKKIVDKYGATNTFLFSIMITGFRLMGYGLNDEPMTAVAIGLLHGISLGLFFVSMVSFVHKIVPPHLRSTGQSLIYTFWAVGRAFGNVMLGALGDIYSIKGTLLINSIGILILFVALVIGKKFFKSYIPIGTKNMDSLS